MAASEYIRLSTNCAVTGWMSHTPLQQTDCTGSFELSFNYPRHYNARRGGCAERSVPEGALKLLLV